MTLHLLKLCVGAESISDLEEWIAERQAQRHRQVHQRPRALPGHDVVMPGLAADDATERHHGIVGLAGTGRGLDVRPPT